MEQKTRLNTYNNSWYKPGKPRWMLALWFIVNGIFVNSWLPGSRWRIFILRLFGAEMGRHIIIKPHVNIKYPWKLKVGSYTWVGEKVWIDNLGHVNIGEHCCISQGALLLCGNHNYKKSTFDLIVADIVMENGSWIGAKSIVCGGVTMKKESVLTAGSLASTDLEAYAVYAGNPAQKIRNRQIEE